MAKEWFKKAVHGAATSLSGSLAGDIEEARQKRLAKYEQALGMETAEHASGLRKGETSHRVSEDVRGTTEIRDLDRDRYDPVMKDGVHVGDVDTHSGATKMFAETIESRKDAAALSRTHEITMHDKKTGKDVFMQAVDLGFRGRENSKLREHQKTMQNAKIDADERVAAARLAGKIYEVEAGKEARKTGKTQVFEVEKPMFDAKGEFTGDFQKIKHALTADDELLVYHDGKFWNEEVYKANIQDKMRQSALQDYEESKNKQQVLDEYFKLSGGLSLFPQGAPGQTSLDPSKPKGAGEPQGYQGGPMQQMRKIFQGKQTELATGRKAREAAYKRASGSQ